MHAHSAVWKRLAHVLIGLTLVFNFVRPLFTAPRVAHAAGPYVVDANLDAPDANLADGFCDDGVGDCTLRAALQQARQDGVPTTITFNSALANTTLVLDDTYGTILWDGDNITVTGGSNNITISGQNLTAGKSALTIEGNSNYLTNIKVKQAPEDGIQVGDYAGVGTGHANHVNNVTVYGNGAAGIHVHGGGSGGGQNNLITSSLIGAATLTACGSGNNVGVFEDLNATGAALNVNTMICNTSHGVEISQTNGALVQGNSIGIANNVAMPNGGNGVYAHGTTSAYFHGNYISGNGLNGMLFENSRYAGVYANNIGTNVGVSGAVPNGGDGLVFASNSDHNSVGGNLLGDRNIIGGNAGSGIVLDGSGTHDNKVTNNYIGTNLAGSAAIANGANGIQLQNGAHDNLIGGTSVAVRNLISGNGQGGILIDASNTNTITSNLIGLNASGNNPLPNQIDGIWINNNSTGNIIGSSDVNEAQFISGNFATGVVLINSNGNWVKVSNRIGAGISGNALGNGDGGVLVINSADNTVKPTIVANNGHAGLAAIGSTSTGNYLVPGHVYANSGLPIDLGNDGATRNDGDNDTGAGPNNLLEYPVITAAAGNILTGTVCAGCFVYVYQAIGNPAAAYGGGDFLQLEPADGLGNWTTTLPVGLTKLNVTLLASDASSNTSEMSPRPILYLPLVRR